MKTSLFLIIFLSFAWIACKNDSSSVQRLDGGPNSEMIKNPATANLPTDTNQLARISYEMPEYDFGTVKEGDIVNYSFKFTNTGKVPLTILKARSSCGCTIPVWPEDPIPPGGTSEINAKFDTDGKMNNQVKVITVTANTYPNESRVKLKGIVTPTKDTEEHQ